MARHALTPYKILTTLLFGRLGCLERSPVGRVTAAATPLARALGLRTTQLRDSLQVLVGLGLVTHLRWGGTWFSCVLDAPVDCQWTVGATLDVGGD